MPKNDFIPDISTDDLTPIVRANVGGELEGAWKTTAIGDGIGLGTIGIFRVSGRSRQASGSAEPWTAILKIVDKEKEHTGLREYELARSSDFQSIREGLRPATCFGTQERSGSERLDMDGRSCRRCATTVDVGLVPVRGKGCGRIPRAIA